MEQGSLMASLRRVVAVGRHWRWAPPEVVSDVWLMKSEEIGESLPIPDFLMHGAHKRGFMCRNCEILVLDFNSPQEPA
jgi:hypothetical protein